MTLPEGQLRCADVLALASQPPPAPQPAAAHRGGAAAHQSHIVSRVRQPRLSGPRLPCLLGSSLMGIWAATRERESSRRDGRGRRQLAMESHAPSGCALSLTRIGVVGSLRIVPTLLFFTLDRPRGHPNMFGSRLLHSSLSISALPLMPAPAAVPHTGVLRVRMKVPVGFA